MNSMWQRSNAWFVLRPGIQHQFSHVPEIGAYFKIGGEISTISARFRFRRGRYKKRGMVYAHYPWDPILPKNYNFEYSGDLTIKPDSLMKGIDMKKLIPEVRDIPEMQNASDAIKRMFSLEFAPNKVINQEAEEMLIKKFAKHEGDRSSLEVRIAVDTLRIRIGIQNYHKNLGDKKSKRQLVARIHRRNGLIRQLRQINYPSFLMILRELQIKYQPLTRESEFKTADDQRKKQVIDQSLTIVRKKMEKLKEKFDQERTELKAVKEELVNIKEEEEELATMEEELKRMVEKEDAERIIRVQELVKLRLGEETAKYLFDVPQNNTHITGAPIASDKNR